ncbi:MAG: tripartite tricarboxylate transporter substrate binding protein [Bryobacterales bacterium]|nr:tripartite tricarboxylate transporter substrate binding protein [Bryobacterales bacterium]
MLSRMLGQGTKRRFAVQALAAAVLLFAVSCRHGDGPYPSKELKLIVQASPGGISDTVSRFMGSLIEKDLGVPVVCENKPGASGALAFSYVARRAPDGYTLGHASIEIAIVRTLGYADVGPDNMGLICLVSKTPAVLVVREDAPWNSFGGFIAAAGKQRGGLILAHSGTGSIWHFNALLMEQAADIRVTYVPYGGTSRSLASLLGGHVDAVIAGTGEAIANVKAGRLKALAVLDESRSQLYPETPTSYELGYDFGAPAWSGFFAPAGVPDAILERLEKAFRKGFASSEWARLCRERGMEAVFMGRKEFREFALQEAAFFGREIPRLLTLER